MATKTKSWSTGSGSATIQYDGHGDGNIIITSDANNLYEARSMQITVETTNGSPKQTNTITINQAAKQRIDLSAAVVTASNQTYNGSAKTPTPTVTLDDIVVPSSGYDVVYSNNTNAGIATITVTGKGEYTGTATGTFTINKASRTLSFADTYMVLNTSSTGTMTATPSAGSGDGAITYSIANTTYATINSSTGAVTSKTSDGSVIVTASIAEGQNYLGATATYTLYVFATTHDYSYSGSAKNVTLPPGTYKLECWGAQGGSNGTNSTYGITAKAGGKGGYSVSQLTTAQALAIQVLVGGQGSASAAGYNGGGSTTGTSQYNSGDTFGYSKMGGGGGASDIRLSDGSLYSRMIVAGGGSGGAMCYKAVTTSISQTTDIWPTSSSSWELGSIDNSGQNFNDGIVSRGRTIGYIDISNATKLMGSVKTISSVGGIMAYWIAFYNSSKTFLSWSSLVSSTSETQVTIPSNAAYIRILCRPNPDSAFEAQPSRCAVAGSLVKTYTSSSTSTSTDYQTGYAGGGTNGVGYSSSYYGTQSAAGSNGSFGQGANQSTTGYRYCSGAGGGGWYGGGGGQKSDSSMIYVHYSGGGSGFVNTAASAGNRPSGYTGLELDSGTTYAGDTSFPAPGGGNETGHSGNGYIRITRIS